MIDLAKRCELLDRSTGRLKKYFKTPEEDRDAVWWALVKKETWVNLKRSFELWWHVRRGRG